MTLKIILFLIAFAIEFFLIIGFLGIPGFVVAIIVMLVFVYSGIGWKNID